MSSISTYSTIYGSLTKKAYLTDITFSYFMGLNNFDAVDLFSDEKKITLTIKPTAPPPQLTTDELLFEQYLIITFSSEHTQRRWSRDQVRELFRMHLVDNIKVTHAAVLSEINSNTALGYIRQAKNGLNKQPNEEA
ncbi:hypothetical protein [Parasitella parasitica]|uniref:Uncharacterized protein n=1 Tax=Parasitella parasitica TaxID=35722 RepID=A0A0B7N1U9_9FUNG|nr:hypothetical protein [Parasitella parasitica]